MTIPSESITGIDGPTSLAESTTLEADTPPSNTPLELSAVEIESIYHGGFSAHPGTNQRSVADPFALYANNIVAAERGDPAAQYAVWKALYACSQDASPPGAIEEVRASGAYEDWVVEISLENNQHCQKLVDLLPIARMKEDRDRFLERAALEGKNLQAALQYLVKKGGKPPLEALRPLLERTLKDADTFTFQALALLHTRYSEYDPVRYLTWDYLSCQAHELCNPRELLGVAKHFHAEYEIDQIMEDAEAIKLSIMEDNFDFLGEL